MLLRKFHALIGAAKRTAFVALRVVLAHIVLGEQALQLLNAASLCHMAEHVKVLIIVSSRGMGHCGASREALPPLPALRASLRQAAQVV